ncbi:MAG TPA: ABC transporter permease [Propionicimonas sp.]|uniref:ABC transporter permease n=1 Tax=Propionicimonas sp. TaxID=1955623 RepID=UPI002F41B17D
MSGLDLTPAAAPAPRASRIRRHALIETRLVVRNGEQLLLALVIPLGLILANAAVGARLGIAREPFIASVIALGLWSSGFTSPAITTAFERRYGVLERLVATPLRRADLLLGKAAMVATIAVGQAVVLGVAGLLAGWSPRPTPGTTLIAVATVAFGLVTFTGLALILAGTASAELTLGLANLVYLLGAAGGLMVPLAAFPPWSQPVLALLPTTAVAEALRAWSGEAATGTFPGWTILVTLAWAVTVVVIARKVFRWTS